MSETSRMPDNASNRDLCFSQGKLCVYRPSDAPSVIRTGWCQRSSETDQC